MVREKIILVCFFCIGVIFSKSQFRCDLASANVKQISNNNWVSENNEMLPFCKNILTNNNVLILSESDHGDGASIDAQCKIIKNLIDSALIKSIFIEASWINVEKISELLKKGGEDSVNATLKYMRSTQLMYWVSNGFWSYLTNKIIDGKVKLYGFDISGISGLIVKDFFLEALELNEVKEFKKRDSISFNSAVSAFEYFDGWGLQSNCNEKYYLSLTSLLNIIIERYTKDGEEELLKKWNGVKDFFYWLYKRTLVLKGNKISNVPKDQIQNSLFHYVRDSIMAKIFIEKYLSLNSPKSVVLMSNYHSLRNTYNIKKIEDCCKSKTVNTMGEIIDKSLKGSYYSICFVAASGNRFVKYKSNNIFSTKIQKPHKLSLEYCLNQSNYKFAFLDLQSSAFQNLSFYMAPVFGKYLEANWAKVYSGIFFIKNMYILNIKMPNE